MGYRITYGKIAVKKQLSIKSQLLAKRITAWVVALIFLLGIGWIGWSNQSIRHWLLPGDPQITEAALEGLIVDIKRGETLPDAITTFCKEIIDGAKHN